MNSRYQWKGTQLQLLVSIHSILNSTLRSISFPRTFNPADYAEPAQTEENYGGGSTWNNTGSVDLEEGASKLIY